MGLRNDELIALARTLSPLAARRCEDGVLLAKASGCRVFDADNVAYVDLLGGGGSNLLGYANQYLLDAVRKASSFGLASGFHATAEVELVELLSEILPEFGPWVLTPAESEAWELALRWCRRDTGRQRVIVFDGNRRGSVEALQVSAAGPLGMSQPLVAGVPAELARLVRVVPWGDTDAFVEILGEVGVDTAAVVLDPIASLFGVLRPDLAFLQTVQEHTAAVGARLIVDETLTGFRLARGGAVEAFGLQPDVMVLGGTLGGGVSPIGAVTWPRRLQTSPGDELPAPAPPISVLAATATLSVLRNESIHQRLEERGAQLQAGVEALAEKFGRSLRCNRIGSILALCFARTPVTDGRSFARVDQELWTRFARGVRENGVLMPSRSPVTSFLSHAHGVKDIEKVLAAMDVTLRRMQKEDEA